MSRPRHHWVFLRRCGCAFAVVEKNSYCRDEDKAWREIYQSRAEERAAVASGVHVVFVDHDTYVREHSASMLRDCEHAA